MLSQSASISSNQLFFVQGFVYYLLTSCYCLKDAVFMVLIFLTYLQDCFGFCFFFSYVFFIVVFCFLGEHVWYVKLISSVFFSFFSWFFDRVGALSSCSFSFSSFSVSFFLSFLWISFFSFPVLGGSTDDYPKQVVMGQYVPMGWTIWTF